MPKYPSKLKVLDLFSGIGGFSLGLERTGGFDTVAFCEVCPKARQVLRKHWQDIPIYEDVKTLTSEQLESDNIKVDVITGGFPCQDISTCGKGAGIEGERSGLFYEIIRLANEIRPHYVILENVSALLGRGMDVVLGELSKIGFDAEWHCIPASSIGAPHRRDRIWIIAYRNTNNSIREAIGGIQKGTNAECSRIRSDVSYPTSWQGYEHEANRGNGEIETQTIFGDGASALGKCPWWSNQSPVCRVLDGVSDGLHKDRLKQLGNSVVPQIPELIGNAILEANNV